MSNEDLVTECKNSVVYASRSVMNWYGTWVEQDDVMQEMWMWIYERPDTIRNLLAEDKKGILTFRLRKVGEAHGRREKAAKSGYRPGDEFFYTRAVIEAMLPYAFDPEAALPGDQPEVKYNKKNGGIAADRYGDWEACLVDVRTALAKLDGPDRKLLALRYWLGDTLEVMAKAEGMATSSMHTRLNRIIKRIQRDLGGANPHPQPAEATAPPVAAVGAAIAA